MLINQKIPATYIVNKIKYDLLFVFILSVISSYMTSMYGHVLPVIPLSIPVFLGTSISILLSFKLNQSYDRWWEARKIWGAIVNDSRTFVIQLNSLILSEENDSVKKMAKRQIAWNYALGESLRGKSVTETLKSHLDENDIKELEKFENKPLGILHLQSQTIKKLRKEGKIDEFTHIQMDNTQLRFCDSMGKCERIKSTVFPATYKLFLHWVIYLFIIILSVSLVDIESHYEIPLLLLISSAFFLLEKSASHMQDPFSNKPTDTAMTAIAAKIENNICEMIGMESSAVSENKNSFFIM